jgi:hypothetical protein
MPKAKDGHGSAGKTIQTPTRSACFSIKGVFRCGGMFESVRPLKWKYICRKVKDDLNEQTDNYRFIGNSIEAGILLGI